MEPRIPALQPCAHGFATQSCAKRDARGAAEKKSQAVMRISRHRHRISAWLLAGQSGAGKRDDTVGAEAGAISVVFTIRPRLPPGILFRRQLSATPAHL